MAKGKEAAVLDNHRAELLRLKQLRNKKGSYRRDKVFEVPKGLGIAWIARPRPLIRSRVWASLAIYHHRAIAALECEHMDHAGKENGFLIFTYDDGVRAGIPRASFNSTIGWLIEVGLVEKTHNGGYAGGALRDPSRYRLTYLPQKHEEAIGGPTYLFPIHNWVDIELEVLDGKRFLREKKHKAPSRKTRRLKHDTNQIIKSDTDAAARASSAATKALATERYQI